MREGVMREGVMREENRPVKLTIHASLITHYEKSRAFSVGSPF